jgi:hypothetical protein
MNDKTLWQIFTDTGDPVCWLMYRAAERKPEASGDYNRTGTEGNPAPAD